MPFYRGCGCELCCVHASTQCQPFAISESSRTNSRSTATRGPAADGARGLHDLSGVDISEAMPPRPKGMSPSFHCRNSSQC
eukprot:7960777-Pyramimonas_sp.AAC.2